MFWICVYIFFWFYIFRVFIRSFYGICRSKTCLVGKTALITGGNKGIGFQTSLGLASRGCRVIIACRSDAEDAKNEIIDRTGNRNIITKKLDLSSLASVRSLCEDLNKNEQKIDILINNAALAASLKLVTEDGLDMIMQCNVLGPFLLTHLLIDLLKKAKKARVIFVSSLTAYFVTPTLEQLEHFDVSKKSLACSLFPHILQYSRSKISLVLISNKFAELLKPLGITCNSVHPGVIFTNIYKDNDYAKSKKSYDMLFTAICRSYQFLVYLFFMTPEEGAQRTLKLALSKSYENVTGKFLWDLGTYFPPKLSRNVIFRDELWAKAERWVKLEPKEKL